jgi:hypothetical protein
MVKKERAGRLSEIARALVRERWRKVSPKERSEHARKLVQIRWSKATDEDRQAARERMEKAREKRWPAKGRKDNVKKKRK